MIMSSRALSRGTTLSIPPFYKTMSNLNTNVIFELGYIYEDWDCHETICMTANIICEKSDSSRTMYIFVELPLLYETNPTNPHDTEHYIAGSSLLDSRETKRL